MTETRPLILDLSEWNGNVDFAKMKSMNVSAVGIRASWLKEDTRFKEYWAKAKEVGIPRFAYHFRDWRGPGPVQLALFNGLLANDPGELPPCLDLEMDATPYSYSLNSEPVDMMPETRKLIGSPTMPEKYQAMNDSTKLSLSPNQVQGLTWDFLMGMKSQAKRTPILYTGYYYFLQWFKGASTSWNQFPLWLPWYAPENMVKVPPPWTKWWAWQNTGNGNGPSFGASGLSMDESLYNGTLAELQAFIGGAPVPTPTPIPVINQYVTIYRVNVREKNDPNSTKLGTIPINTTLVVNNYVANQYSYFQPINDFPNGGYVYSAYIKKKEV